MMMNTTKKVESGLPLSAQRNDVTIDEIDQRGYGFVGYSLIVLSTFLVAITLPVSLCYSLRIVREYQRAVVFRLGKIRHRRSKGPGILFVIPCIDHVVLADIRTQTFEVPPQEILTKDSVTISVDAVVYIRIFDPTLSIIHVENPTYSTRELSATTLRKVLGTKTLQQSLQQREIVAKLIQEALDEVTHEWGVEVERVEVKDISLPTHLQRIMAVEAEASREYKASIIYADGELRASEPLKNAANAIGGSPLAIQLRYLQTLASITAKNESTLMFPIPISFLDAFKPPPKTAA